jgi:uncharacterized protein with PQ loop repeat
MWLILTILFLYVIPALITYVCILNQYKNEWKTINTGKLSETNYIIILIPLLNFGYMIFAILRILTSIIDEKFK